MKQPKSKTPVKSARKVAKSELKARLLTTLKTILDKDKIELTKKIKKRSKKLVKAVTDELVIAKPAAPKVKKEKTEKPAETKAIAPTPKATAVKSAKKAPAKAEPVKKAPAKAKTEEK